METWKRLRDLSNSATHNTLCTQQDENLGLSTLLPLGTLTYTVTSRALPRPTAVTIEGSSLAADRVADLNKQAVQRASLITVQGLMWLRAQILAAEGPGTSVVFEGVETGQVGRECLTFWGLCSSSYLELVLVACAISMILYDSLDGPRVLVSL